ncbi:MAG: TIGR03960 family B12-binding radical SAM protein [Candidatus Omnitrophota bacterium]|jgi:radical SAM family uncharacterized protein
MEDFLLQVRKPARYIGREWNMSQKDISCAEVKFALCFPDLYDVGMSNLGIRIIYDILNKLTYVACERFFACAVDLEAVLREKNQEIFSLESGRPLKEFDIVGFSLGYELHYTNVLNMLQLGSIPLQSSARDKSYPLIIGGGPGVLNPEPMHEFFDLFVIGEAEEAIVEIIDCYHAWKKSDAEKIELLIKLSGIEGVYVPALYSVTSLESGVIKEFKPKYPGVPVRVKKRIVGDLNKSPYPLDWLIPYIQIIHDRITLEVMRGCPNRCRFCQARVQYFPFRQRDAEKALHLACELYKRTGYEEISLAGLSVSDYTGLEILLQSLVGKFQEDAVSVSLPSIKPKFILQHLSTLIASIKKTGLTFAPEAGSERLRRILAKDYDIQEFFRVLEQAYANGYRHVKLYFMIGLPFEEKKDLDGIIELATRVSELKRKFSPGPAQVNISINPLIPKPHTPFQWFAMDTIAALKEKQGYIRGQGRNKRLKIDFHHLDMSFLEGVLSRGDRRLSAVILKAFSKGARFDAWGEYFNLQTWMDAFRECDIDPQFYLQNRSRDEVLPWDFIDMGVGKDFLKREAEAVDQEIKDCAE